MRLEDRFVFGKSLFVQGTDDNNLSDELKKALDDYYAGRGIPLAILRKYYGLGESLTITPT